MKWSLIPETYFSPSVVLIALSCKSQPPVNNWPRKTSSTDPSGKQASWRNLDMDDRWILQLSVLPGTYLSAALPVKWSRVKHADPCCSRVASTDGPASDTCRLPLIHVSLKPPISSRDEEDRLGSLGVEIKADPLCGQTSGVERGGKTEGLKRLSGSKAFITSRS